MKIGFVLAVASAITLAAPAKAARYISFTFAGRGGALNGTLDTLAMPSNKGNMFVDAQGFGVGQFYYSIYNIGFSLGRAYPDGGFYPIYQSFSGGANFSPAIDLSAANFSYDLSATNFNAWAESIDYYDPNVGGTGGYTGFSRQSKLTQFRVIGSDIPTGPIGFFFDWSTPETPEPSTWAMMLAGIGAIGASVRRKRGSSVPTGR